MRVICLYIWIGIFEFIEFIDVEGAHAIEILLFIACLDNCAIIEKYSLAFSQNQGTYKGINLCFLLRTNLCTNYVQDPGKE